jgi:tetratricopeptide (TPR) repeat protein
MHDYNASDLQRLSGADASVVRSLARAGHIQPVKRGGRFRYSFHDLIIVRTARALRGANVSPRKVNLALARLRDSLPAGAPLSGVSVTVLGNQVAVREGDALFEPESGQYALQLEVVLTAGELHVLKMRSPPAPATDPAAAHFARALYLEATDAIAAVAAYRACLNANAQHLEACINLGRLLHELGRLSDAEAVYGQAAAPDPLLLFNLAVLLEDLEREVEAIQLYRTALALDPSFADAHFNLARLHERAGRSRDSFRHLLAHRRLLNREDG